MARGRSTRQHVCPVDARNSASCCSASPASLIGPRRTLGEPHLRHSRGTTASCCFDSPHFRTPQRNAPNVSTIFRPLRALGRRVFEDESLGEDGQVRRARPVQRQRRLLRNIFNGTIYFVECLPCQIEQLFGVQFEQYSMFVFQLAGVVPVRVLRGGQRERVLRVSGASPVSPVLERRLM